MNFTNMYFKTCACEKNKSLERAVNERNSNEVKILISNGANVNHTINQNLDTMLHSAKNTGIARDLLGYSANVNARNLYERTPLHLSVLDGKGKEMVLTLIQHGALIDVKDSQGNTPLNYAVKSEVKNLEVIQVLVMNGARICNLRSINVADKYSSPLEDAILLNDMPTIKTLIAYSLLKNGPINYGSSLHPFLSNYINITPYFRSPCYQSIKNFLSLCCNELKRMEIEKLNEKLTLLQVVVSPYLARESFGRKSEDMKLFAKNACEIIAGCHYPIYKDVIYSKLKVKVDKSALVKILPDLNIYIEVTEGSPDKSKQVILNPDVTSVLAKYLSSDNLFSFILAYYQPSNEARVIESIPNFSNIRKNINKRPCEATAGSVCSKLMKLASLVQNYKNKETPNSN